MAHLGIDIGGTKTLVCFGTLEGEVIAEERFPTKIDAPFIEQQLPALIETAKKMTRGEEIESIGLSHPGPISLKRGCILTPPNLPHWHNTPVVQVVQEAFNRPVYFQNDANAAALAEYYFGHRKNTANLIYLTASTGMGGGLIIDHKLLEGASDIAGEVAYLTLDPSGPPFRRGLFGTFEAYCGGAAIAATYGASVRDLLIDVRAGKPKALAVWDTFIERLAQGIGILLMTLNPEAILLGTIAHHAGDLLFGPLQAKLPRYALSEAISAATIEASKLGEKRSALSSLATIRQRTKP